MDTWEGAFCNQVVIGCWSYIVYTTTKPSTGPHKTFDWAARGARVGHSCTNLYIFLTLFKSRIRQGAYNQAIALPLDITRLLQASVPDYIFICVTCLKFMCLRNAFHNRWIFLCLCNLTGCLPFNDVTNMIETNSFTFLRHPKSQTASHIVGVAVFRACLKSGT